MPQNKRVAVLGGAGYVGAVLVPKLLQQGYDVKVLDLYIYGDDVLDSVKGHPHLEQIKGDIRDTSILKQVLSQTNAVIHLACISNDPSFELNPTLGKSINFDAFPNIVQLSKECGVRRFVFASSSSVYGVKQAANVTEDLPLEPLTDYSKYKALCEDILLKHRAPGFVTLILRPATVCGYSPRLRLDLTVNILTNHAFTNHRMKVFGGLQMRPNIHIEDMTDLYLKSLEWEDRLIDGKIFNAGYDNHTVLELAEIVRKEMGNILEIQVEPTDDNRSYHISSEKIKKELGFVPCRSVKHAVKDLLKAFEEGKVPNSMMGSRYYNIKRMQEINLK